MTTPSLMRIAGFRRLSRVVSHAAASSSSSSPPPPSSRRVAPPSHLAPRATQRHHHHRHHLAAAAGPPGHRRRRHGGARATADADPGVANPGLDAANLRIRGVSVEGDDVRAVLANAGLSPTQVDAVTTSHPDLETYDLAREVVPRVNYLRFLHDNDRLGGESVADAIARQPHSLERRFHLVHECEDYPVVNKPWCVRLDTPRGWKDAAGNPLNRFTPKYPGDLSVEDWLEERYPGWDTVRFVHQLDNATSGVLVAASNKRAAGRAAKLFRERAARKAYIALVFGHPREDEWTCDAKLGRDPSDPKGFKERVVVDGEEEGVEGKASETRFKVLQRGTFALRGKHEGADVSKVLVTPITGRRHQIRVHLAHGGYPIVGDAAYSEDKDTFRTFLHAHALTLPFDAKDGGTKTFTAPEPPSFAAAIL